MVAGRGVYAAKPSAAQLENPRNRRCEQPELGSRRALFYPVCGEPLIAICRRDQRGGVARRGGLLHFRRRAGFFFAGDVEASPQVSQPEAFSTGGTTQVVPRTQIDVDTGEGKKFGVMRSGVTLQELVDSLNALGVSPRDMISILQSIKAAGALQAEIVLM